MKEAVVVVIAALAIGMAEAQFKCEVDGRFLDRLSNCTQFYDCQRDSNNEFRQIKMKCPNEELFSIEEQRCVLASNLMCRLMSDGTTTSLPILTTPALTSDPSYTTIEISNNTTPNPWGDFTCPAVGRFPTNFPGCKQYYNCKQQSRGILMELVSCPETTLFHPELAKCVLESEYECPTGSTPPADGSSTTTDDYTNGKQT